MDAAHSRAQRQCIEEEAARLVIDLASRPPDSAARHEALRWAAQSPTHGVALAQAEAAWSSSERLRAAPPEEVGPAADDVHASPNRRRVLMSGIAAGVVAIPSALLLRQMLRGERLATGIGELRTVALADGSTLHLNTDTLVDVDLRPGARLATLLRGEAMFDIAQDAHRPFLVSVGAATLRAMGSAFNVRLHDSLVELVVERGLVGVVDGGRSLQRVAAGNSAAIHDGAIAINRLAPDMVSQRLAWQQGMINFDGQTLAQAVDQFNRYLPHPLVIADPSLASLRLGGTFAINEADKFVDALQQSFAVKAVPAEDGSVLLTSSRCLGTGGSGTCGFTSK